MSSDDNYDEDNAFYAVPMDDDVGQVDPPPKERKRRRPRRKKDPNKPRGPLTPYMCFSKSIRPSVMEEHPSAKVTEVAKIIGHKWHQLTDEDKEPYKDLASQDRARYKREMENYVPTAGYEDTGRRRRKKKDPNAPKKSKSAYFLFADERRDFIKAEAPDLRVGDIAKRTGAEWRNLTDEQKKPYFDKAAILKEEYLVRLAEYKRSLQEENEEEEEEEDDDDDDDDDE